MANTRTYAIRNASGDLVGIVEAFSGPQALRHFARDQFTVETARFEDGVLAASNGIEVQRAADEQVQS